MSLLCWNWKEHRFGRCESPLIRFHQQYISHNTEREDHPQDVGDWKELPLMKGIETMMWEKVDRGGGRVSVHVGLCSGPEMEKPRQTRQNEGEAQGQSLILKN